jgi:hypothetical protein
MPKLPPRPEVRREHDVGGEVRSYLSDESITHWRNNVGANVMQSGHYVVYGLCDGSADLIACVPTRLSCPECGAALPPIGRFVGIETKHPKRGTHGDNQLDWARVVTSAHGVAGFARSVEAARIIVEAARTQW